MTDAQRMTLREVYIEDIEQLDERLTWRKKRLARSRRALNEAKALFSKTACSYSYDRQTETAKIIELIKSAIKVERDCKAGIQLCRDIKAEAK